MSLLNEDEEFTPVERASAQTFLFHASLSPMEAVLNEARRSVRPGKQWLEDEFERFRGDRSISRMRAFFATATVADCLFYHNIQTDHAPAFLYKVKMPSPHRHPMALIGKVENHHGNTDEQLEQIANEYWQPTKNWKFWEYLDSSMEIVDRVGTASKEMVAGAHFRYLMDRDLANDLWPNRSSLASAFSKLQDSPGL